MVPEKWEEWGSKKGATGSNGEQRGVEVQKPKEGLFGNP